MIRSTCLIIILLIATLTSPSFAQASNDDHANDKPAVDKKLSMVDNTEFSIDDFVKGYIIMPSNRIKAGLLRFNGITLIFKDTLTEKTKRYSPQEIKGFIAQVDTSKTYDVSVPVIKGLFYKTTSVKKKYGDAIPVDTFKVFADSFVVKSTGGHSSFTDKVVHDNKFVKQLIYGDKVCLYKTTQRMNTPGMMMNGAMTTGNSYLKNIFYFKRKSDSTYTEIPKGKRAFKKLITAYLKDNNPLVLAINNDQYGFDDLEQVTMIYNQDKF